MRIARLLSTTVLSLFVFQGCSGSGAGESAGPTVSLAASPATVSVGGTAILTWTATRATTCMGSGGWSGPKAVAGNEATAALAGPITFTLTCTGPGGSVSANAAVSTGTTESSVAFPLRVERDKRYLVDAAGNPFLIQGDAPWSLIVQLTREQVDTYLDDRHARGFNTLLVNLLEHRYANNPPKNVYGDAPFLTPGDFSTPNERYFAHADWVLRRAAQKGFLVLLAPAYLGYNGKDQGWYQEMSANGISKLRAYGRYLGRRYQSFTNILWVNAGDFDPPDRSLVDAVAAGILELEPDVPQTAHCGPDTAAVDYWGEKPWLQVNTVYTHKPVYAAAATQYERSGRIPFFLIESTYENEHDIPVVRVRAQAYHALLSGAAGQVFGNNPVWNFNGRPLFPTPLTWQQQLGSAGARSMTHLRNLFGAIRWWTLVPDTAGRVLTSGLGSDQDRAVAAIAADNTFAIAYLPGMRDVKIDLSRLAGGSQVKARWYDPAAGIYRPASGSPYAARGTQTFRPPGPNGDQAGDWVLVLESGP